VDAIDFVDALKIIAYVFLLNSLFFF